MKLYDCKTCNSYIRLLNYYDKTTPSTQTFIVIRKTMSDMQVTELYERYLRHRKFIHGEPY